MDRFSCVFVAGLVSTLLFVGGCAVVPYPDEMQASHCPDTQSRPQTLRMVNVLTETGTNGLGFFLASPITVPVTAVISGIYVASNNIYNYYDQWQTCGDYQERGTP